MCLSHSTFKEDRFNIVSNNSRQHLWASSPGLLFHCPPVKGVPKLSMKQKACKLRGLIYESSEHLVALQNITLGQPCLMLYSFSASDALFSLVLFSLFLFSVIINI